MFGPKFLSKGVYWVGVNDYIKELFESLWPLPYGVSYNAYVIIGENAVALIDTVDEEYAYEYLGKVGEVVDDVDRVRFVVANHLEPDHHGATPHVLKHMKAAKVVTSQVGKVILRSLYDIPEDRLIVVKDGDEIDLGGKTLRFIYTPWLHWPETMVTYLKEDGILFSCDIFGSYGALETGIFDDEVDAELYLGEAKRYFSNIVSKYTRNVLEAVEKLKGLGIKMVAPSHGPIYRTESGISRIMELYVKWSRPEPDRDKVVVVHSSMYGRGEKLAEDISRRLREAGMKVFSFDVSIVHPSFILSEVIDALSVVFVYPSYDAGIFPYMENLLYLLQVKQLGRGRNAAVVNLYAWASTAKQVVDVLQKAGFRIIEPVVETRALLDEAAAANVDRLLRNIVAASRQ